MPTIKGPFKIEKGKEIPQILKDALKIEEMFKGLQKKKK